ncbi:peptidase M28 family protein, partial [Flavobacteriaceae bacterium]|nr:peptidase M28 family protein [Flavobacteriaceae bacterium]
MKNFILSTLLIIPFFVFSQTDEKVISEIYTNSLTNGQSYSWLDYLSNNIGSRLSGSLGAEKAVEWTKDELESMGLDKVWLQPVMVPKWVRGVPEFAYIETSPGKTI